jgi:hypothetical protein
MSGSFAAIDSEGAIHTAHYVNSKVDASSWPPKFWKFHLQMDDGGRGTVLIFSTLRGAFSAPLRAGSPPRCSDGEQVN